LAKLTSNGATALQQANFIFVPGTLKDSMPKALRSSLAGHPLGLVSSLIIAINDY
jgi:hypothetical protein